MNETAPPRTRRTTHPPYNWQLRAQTLEKQVATDANTIAELKRQVAALTLQAIQPPTVTLNITGQPMIHPPDYMCDIFVRDYNAGREKFPGSPMYETFDTYMIERLKDLIWSFNGRGIGKEG